MITYTLQYVLSFLKLKVKKLRLQDVNNNKQQEYKYFIEQAIINIHNQQINL